jgi:hypothetical protein
MHSLFQVGEEHYMGWSMPKLSQVHHNDLRVQEHRTDSLPQGHHTDWLIPELL